MPASRTLAVLLLTTALLFAASACRAAADKHGGGRMAIVIRRAPGTSWVAAARGASLDRSISKWHGRRLEDEVAPEFGAGGQLELGAGQGRYISYDAVAKPDSAACGDRCAAKGAPYTRPCTYREHCRG